MKNVATLVRAWRAVAGCRMR